MINIVKCFQMCQTNIEKILNKKFLEVIEKYKEIKAIQESKKEAELWKQRAKELKQLQKQKAKDAKRQSKQQFISSKQI